jgi:FkbM family methyltransferase
MALLKLDHLKNKYNLKISKIAHIGAHKGQEVDEYLNIFPEVMIHLFEPQLDLFEYLTENFKNFKNISLHNYALGSSNGVSTMFISNNEGQSSSFFEPKEHLNEHPEVKFKKGSNTYEIKVLDELEIEDIDLLNIDTQGYEMEVLKGSRKLLSQGIKYIILEVNKKELYEGCPLVKDIDKFLKKYGFIRTDTHYWMDSYNWGDAFYIKKDLISYKRQVFSTIKNTLFSISSLYNLLIQVRNIIWKVRRQTS